MYEIIEKGIRHPHFAKGGNVHQIWYARDEKDFVRKVRQISTLDPICIYHKTDADTLLFEFDETDYSQIENWDRYDLELSGYDYYVDLANSHPYSWKGTLYRADFLEGFKEGDYTDKQANEFEAYKAFLRFVSHGVEIREIVLDEVVQHDRAIISIAKIA